MSLQDDYYDLKSILTRQYPSASKSLDRIWLAFCDMEAREMVRNGEMSEAQYTSWKLGRSDPSN